MNEEEKAIAKLLLEGIKKDGKNMSEERTRGIEDYNLFISACHKRVTIDREIKS